MLHSPQEESVMLQHCRVVLLAVIVLCTTPELTSGSLSFVIFFGLKMAKACRLACSFALHDNGLQGR